MGSKLDWFQFEINIKPLHLKSDSRGWDCKIGS